MKQIKTTIKIAVIAMMGMNLRVSAQNFDEPIKVSSARDAIATFQTTDDKWLYTQWKNNAGQRKAYMGFDSTLTNFILGLENGAHKFSLNNGNFHINSGVLNIKSARDAIATFQTTDDKWLYTQWKNSAGQRKAYMGFDSTLTNFILGLENGANKITFPSGKVGIGTVAPDAKLDVRGDLQISNMGHFKGWKTDNLTGLGLDLGISYGKGYILAYDRTANKYSDVRIVAKGGFNQGITVSTNGNIGIGHDLPDSKLSVNGKIRAQEIKVEAIGWPDFVFEKKYNLPTLTDVENHIKEKGHLKDIPSAKDVEKKGFFLGEMDAKLLQKIEELTLYTIDQQKEIEELKKQNSEIKELKALVQKLLKDKN